MIGDRRTTEGSVNPANQRYDCDIAAIYERHADAVYRLCFLYFKGRSMDVEDAVQSTFIKLLNHPRAFENQRHERAWLLVTAGNTSKNMLRRWWRRHSAAWPDGMDVAAPNPDATLQAVLELPMPYRETVYLHYYEGYSGAEIASMTGRTPSAVWGHLHRGRALLGDMLK